MQLWSSCVVRITPRYDAAATGAATARRQIGIVESHPTLRQPIDIRRLETRMTIAAKILLRNVISNEENEVGLISGKGNATSEDQGKKEGQSHRRRFIKLLKVDRDQSKSDFS